MAPSLGMMTLRLKCPVPAKVAAAYLDTDFYESTRAELVAHGLHLPLGDLDGAEQLLPPQVYRSQLNLGSVLDLLHR